MNPIDEVTLQAYVDGELDAAASARIDAALAQDEVLARRVREARAVRAQLQAAFDPVLDEPVPAHLSALLQGAPPQATTPARAAGGAVQRRTAGAARHRASRRWFVPAAVAAAAVVVLVVALWWRGSSGLVRVRDGQSFAAGALSDALDHALASAPDPQSPITIGLSFRATDGHVCRTFVYGTGTAMAGLACHGRNGWALPALGTVEGAGDGGLRQAASALPPNVQAAVDARIRGDAFDAGQERAARDAGWR